LDNNVSTGNALVVSFGYTPARRLREAKIVSH
jgi:hypothetical protein